MRASSQPSTHSSRRSNHAFTTLRIVHFQVKAKKGTPCRRSSGYAKAYVHSSTSDKPYRPSSASRPSFSSPQSHSSLGKGLPSPRPVSPEPSYPRIQISSLLSTTQTRYHLEVVQQPLKTAEFRNAFLSRLPLTPPVVVRLTLRDTMGNICPVPELEVPFLVAHASLYSSDGLMPLDVPAQASGRASLTSPRLLYGELVATAELLEDLQGNVGCFFIFSDISVRWRGQFQLGISLVSVNRGFGNGSTIAHTRTGTFEVVRQAEYTAAALTRLTQCFIRQGARIATFMSGTR